MGAGDALAVEEGGQFGGAGDESLRFASVRTRSQVCNVVEAVRAGFFAANRRNAFCPEDWVDPSGRARVWGGSAMGGLPGRNLSHAFTDLAGEAALLPPCRVPRLKKDTP